MESLQMECSPLHVRIPISERWYVTLSELSCFLGVPLSTISRFLRKHGHNSFFISKELAWSLIVEGGSRIETVDPKNKPKRKIIPVRVRQLVLERDGKKCRYCLKSLSRSNFHLDHIIPVIYKGLSIPENLVVCCVSCNCSKHANIPGHVGMVLHPSPNGDDKLNAIQQEYAQGKYIFMPRKKPNQLREIHMKTLTGSVLIDTSPD